MSHIPYTRAPVRLAFLLLLQALGIGLPVAGAAPGADSAEPNSQADAPGGPAILTGAGATFPAPLYSHLFDAYTAMTGVRVTYSAVGSGRGIAELLANRVDFGATDAYIPDEELRRIDRGIVHIPTCLGAVAVVCNLPAPVDGQLRLTPENLVHMYTGSISTWADARLARDNPGLELPNLEITAIHRLEASGTTHIFTEYLAKVASYWRVHVGWGKRIRWPVGMGVEGNEGVTRYVRRIPGSIGYVELSRSESDHLQVAAIRNRSGEYIRPTVESVKAAVPVDLPDDLRISITDAPAPGAYPICAFTYLIAAQEQAYDNRTRKRAQALGDLLWWMTHTGQGFLGGMSYLPLPPEAAGQVESLLRSLTYSGEPLTSGHIE